MAQSLTATPGTWAPSDGTYAYQWLADGAPVAGATTAGYTVAAGDLGKVLSVRVTASKAGFVTESATSGPTSAVAPQPQVTNTALPTISDTTPEVGQVLTAGDGTWTPGGLTFAYQWRSDGTDITGATSKTYQVPAGQVGKKLSVRVTWRRGPSTSPARRPRPRPRRWRRPRRSSTPRSVDQRHHADRRRGPDGDARHVDAVRLDVRLPVARRRSAIAGATTSGYTPVAGDVGKGCRCG